MEKIFELCENGNLQQIQAAIEAGADVNAKNKEGRTPLMLARENNSTHGVITTLLNLGADPKMKSNVGKMAIDYAKDNEKLKNTDVFWKLNDASY